MAPTRAGGRGSTDLEHPQIRVDDAIAPQQGNPPGRGEVGAEGDLGAFLASKDHGADCEDKTDHR